MSAVEVLRKYASSCSVCNYNRAEFCGQERTCHASGGEFGECRPAEELSKAINEAVLALEEKKKFIKWLDREIEVSTETTKRCGDDIIMKALSEKRKEVLEEVKGLLK